MMFNPPLIRLACPADLSLNMFDDGGPPSLTSRARHLANVTPVPAAHPGSGGVRAVPRVYSYNYQVALGRGRKGVPAGAG